MAFHDTAGPGDVHQIHNYEYADAPARTSASGFVASDIGKVARQLDNETFWVLTSTTPTWTELTGAGGGGGAERQDYTFGARFAVPAQGTLWLANGGIPTSSVPLIVPKGMTLEGASIAVNVIDASRSYDLEILRNGSVVETLNLPVSTQKISTVTFTQALILDDEIAARLALSTGSGRSTFTRINATLIASET